MGLSPDQFWRLSVLEWRWLHEPAGGGRLTLGEAEALARLYPDETS